MTTKQAAAVLGIKVQTVIRMIHRGELPAQKIKGRWAIDEKAVYNRRFNPDNLPILHPFVKEAYSWLVDYHKRTRKAANGLAIGTRYHISPRQAQRRLNVLEAEGLATRIGERGGWVPVEMQAACAV